MKSNAIVCAIALATLGFGSVSYAQDHDRQGRNWQGHERGHDQRADRRDTRRDARDDGREARREARRDPREARRDPRDGRGDRHADARHDRFQDGRYQRHYGARGPQFYRGGHIPQQYRHQQYVVNDWQGRHLSRPPHGHQWVQVDNDYALIAIATGVIAHLLLSQ